MSEDVMKLSEKEVQCLIADYPWLLNIDYEIIPELKNKGMEYHLTENKRADLILRDRKSGRPVIVEFKAVPFYRENIGQILEYRARILQEYSSEDSILKGIFDNKMFTPILMLVVPECSSEARLACNLSGIEIYEYNKTVPEILVPEKRKTLDEFISTLKDDDIAFNVGRSDRVDEIYTEIHEFLLDKELLDGWKNFRDSAGEYFANLNHLFINKCLFASNEISIGIYENIFENSKEISIEYYSNDVKLLDAFAQEYKRLNLKPENNIQIDEDTYEGNGWSFSISKREFLKDVKKAIEPFVLNYVKVMKNLNLMA